MAEDESFGTVVRRWSVTVGELRAALDGVPDDYEVVLTNADVDDCEIAGLEVDQMFPPALDAPGILTLHQRQIITSEYHFHPRLDVSFKMPTPRWYPHEQAWLPT